MNGYTTRYHLVFCFFFTNGLDCKRSLKTHKISRRNAEYILEAMT